MNNQHVIIILCLLGLLLFYALNTSVFSGDSDTRTEIDNQVFTTIKEVKQVDNTKTYTFEVRADKLEKLEHMMIGLPCGKLSNIQNSAGWPVYLDVLDKESGIYGLKLQNNKKVIADKILSVSFTLSYLGEYCTSIMETWHPKVAYKYNSGIIKDTLDLHRKDIPAHIDFIELQAEAKDHLMEMKSHTNPNDAETTIEILANQNADVKLEIFSLSGMKISTMFIGTVAKGIRNLITFNSKIFPEKKYIYKLSSRYSELYGQLNFSNAH